MTRRYGIWLGLVPIFAIATCGCRTPWQRSQSSEPNFDRLLEIEQADAQDPRGDLMVQHKRPGGRSYQRGQASDLAYRNDQPMDGEEDLFSDELENGQVSDLMKLTKIAVENRQQQSDTDKKRLGAKVSSDPRGTIANAQPDESFSDDAAVAFKMNDQGTFESTDLSEANQLANNGISSRRTTPSDSVRNASYTQSLEDGVRTASATRPIRNEREEDYRDEDVESEADEMKWEEHLRAAIRSLGQSSETSLSPQMQIRRATIARLLSTAIGDLDAAMQPIEGLQPHEQDYFRYQFKALSDSIDPDGNPVASRRWSLAMLSQRKSLEHLAAVSNLEVTNATFCTEVESFGVVTKFNEYEFKPDQELLLYCELDNFVSESVKAGYETQLQGSYEIVDSNGRRVADQLLPMDSHTCRNRRRDYFIAYRMYMPQNVSKGNYTLKLTIEDMKGRKFGQSEINFQIVD